MKPVGKATAYVDITAARIGHSSHRCLLHAPVEGFPQRYFLNKLDLKVSWVF